MGRGKVLAPTKRALSVAFGAAHSQKLLTLVATTTRHVDVTHTHMTTTRNENEEHNSWMVSMGPCPSNLLAEQAHFESRACSLLKLPAPTATHDVLPSVSPSPANHRKTLKPCLPHHDNRCLREPPLPKVEPKAPTNYKRRALRCADQTPSK